MKLPYILLHLIRYHNTNLRRGNNSNRATVFHHIMSTSRRHCDYDELIRMNMRDNTRTSILYTIYRNAFWKNNKHASTNVISKYLNEIFQDISCWAIEWHIINFDEARNYNTYVDQLSEIEHDVAVKIAAYATKRHPIVSRTKSAVRSDLKKRIIGLFHAIQNVNTNYDVEKASAYINEVIPDIVYFCCELYFTKQRDQ